MTSIFRATGLISFNHSETKQEEYTMKNALKVLGALACAVGLSACAATPKYNVEQTSVESGLDSTLVFERTTISDKQGVTTWDVTQVDGEIVKAVKTNEGSTSEQDTALTFIGAATAPLINGAVAHSLRIGADDCGSNCGGGGTGSQQVVQVQVESNSDSAAQSSGAGGCSTCALLE
jgi:hypothetical protein